MSKESHLCYHAVQRIMKINIECLNSALNETDETHQETTTIENVEKDIDSDEDNKNRKN